MPGAIATPDVIYLSFLLVLSALPFLLVLSALPFLLVLSAPGFGARPLCPPVTPLTASLNFLTDVVIRWLTGLVTGPPGEAAFGVVGLLTTAFAMGTVLLWPLVAAAPPMGLLLIAMPGFVCVMVRPS